MPHPTVESNGPWVHAIVKRDDDADGADGADDPEGAGRVFAPPHFTPLRHLVSLIRADLERSSVFARNPDNSESAPEVTTQKNPSRRGRSDQYSS